jgi:AraC family transcriptional regulator
MSEHLHSQVLYQGPLVSISDVRCRPTDGGCGCEEESADHAVVFPRAGVFVKHIASRSVVADCNHVLFFNGRQPYRVSHPVPGGDDCTSFTFDPHVLLEALARYEPIARDRPERPFGLTHGPLEPGTMYFQQHLRQRLRQQEDRVAIEELAVGLLDRVLDRAYRIRGLRPAKLSPDAARLHRDRVEATKTYLAGRFRSPLSLSQIARAVHTSPYHLARLFRREVGIPIHQYLNRLRLGLALERLGDGSPDLTELALDLGYSSHSHFSAAFRQAFGTSPSEFRQTSKNLKV